MHFEQSAILTVHNHVITRNPRITVTHDKHDKYKTWFLHISNVQEEDKGRYMCQINTVTAKTQFGYVHVVGEFSLISSTRKEMSRLSDFDSMKTMNIIWAPSWVKSHPIKNLLIATSTQHFLTLCICTTDHHHLWWHSSRLKKFWIRALELFLKNLVWTFYLSVQAFGRNFIHVISLHSKKWGSGDFWIDRNDANELVYTKTTSTQFKNTIIIVQFFYTGADGNCCWFFSITFFSIIIFSSSVLLRWMNGNGEKKKNAIFFSENL